MLFGHCRYVPVVVAKCGLYLKDTATEVPGTFRVSGSAKRMKELQAVFDNPPKVSYEDATRMCGSVLLRRTRKADLFDGVAYVCCSTS